MVVSDHHSASPQESIVLPGRPRSTNHTAVPPASTTRPETAVTITARRTTTAQVMRGRGEDMSPSSGANGRSGDTATATRLLQVRHPGAPAARPIRSEAGERLTSRRLPSDRRLRAGPGARPADWHNHGHVALADRR